MFKSKILLNSYPTFLCKLCLVTVKHLYNQKTEFLVTQADKLIRWSVPILLTMKPDTKECEMTHVKSKMEFNPLLTQWFLFTSHSFFTLTFCSFCIPIFWKAKWPKHCNFIVFFVFFNSIYCVRKMMLYLNRFDFYGPIHTNYVKHFFYTCTLSLPRVLDY